MQPYRKADEPKDEARPPREHVYAPVHRSAWNSAAPGLIAVTPIVVGAAVAGSGFPIAGLIAAIGVGVGMWFWHKKSRNRGEVSFTVERGRVIFQRAGDDFGGSFALEELEDVALDTKTIERVQDGDALIPALQAINATVGPPADTARIELRTRERTVTLTEDYLSYTETSDAIAKLRVFLRKNGWVPQDERDERDEEPAPKPARSKKKKKR